MHQCPETGFFFFSPSTSAAVSESRQEEDHQLRRGETSFLRCPWSAATAAFDGICPRVGSCLSCSSDIPGPSWTLGGCSLCFLWARPLERSFQESQHLLVALACSMHRPPAVAKLLPAIVAAKADLSTCPSGLASVPILCMTVQVIEVISQSEEFG